MEYDVIIIGAGAAGLFCASQIGQAGKRVLLLDHAQAIGKKILISGGGRCNFTNLDADDPKRYLSENPHFAKSALARYTPQDFLALIDAHHIRYHEKTLGQLFCDESARQIVAMLKSECDRGQVVIKTACTIESIKAENGYAITTNQGSFSAPNLVIATGGPSIPKMGASGFAYEVAKQFGIACVTPRPALVPLKLSDEEKIYAELSGLSLPVIASNARARFEEAALFTHRGLSGPAILQLSSYWREGEAIALDLLAGQPSNYLKRAKAETPKWHLKRALAQALPERLAVSLAERFDVSKMLGDCKDAMLDEIEAALRNWQFHPSGTEGYAKAEVTAGGIDTAALSSKTMEAKAQSGLYFIGEAVDVTGWLGGYNFQWAWSSGFAAAQAITSN